MLPKQKVAINVEVEIDHQEWLNEMAETFDLPDESKALPVLIDYAIQDGDEERVIAFKNLRCRHCLT